MIGNLNNPAPMGLQAAAAAQPQQQQQFQPLDGNRLINAMAAMALRGGQQQPQQQQQGGVMFGPGGQWGYQPQQQNSQTAAAGLYAGAGVDVANANANSANYRADLNYDMGMHGIDVGAGTNIYGKDIDSQTALQLAQMQNEAKWAQMNRLAQMLNSGAQAYGPGQSTPFAGYT